MTTKTTTQAASVKGGRKQTDKLETGVFEKCFGVREIRRKNNPATAQASVQGGRRSYTVEHKLLWCDLHDIRTEIRGTPHAGGWISPDLLNHLNKEVFGKTPLTLIPQDER